MCCCAACVSYSVNEKFCDPVFLLIKAARAILCMLRAPGLQHGHNVCNTYTHNMRTGMVRKLDDENREGR